MALPEKCPLCFASMESQSVVTQHVFGSKDEKSRAFFHCVSCDVRYQYPRLTSEEESRFYAAEFEGFMASRSGLAGGWQKAEMHIAANEDTQIRRMAYLTPFLTDTEKVLEVGCSSGFMLYPLIEMGCKCIGVEPSGVFSEYLKQRDIAVYPSVDHLVASVVGSGFDLITHFFVLEHIADPIAFLRAQLGILGPGGKIIFEVPNVADPLYSIYDIPEFERFYWSIAHPWYFSEQSLHYLLQQLGCPYEIIRDQRYDLSNHMVWARDGKPGGMGRFRDVLGSEFDRIYKQTLISSGHCDTLVAIISKE